MATFARSCDLRGTEFIGADLRGARFTEADLSGVMMRGVNAEGVDIDDPFLCDGGSFLRVNGVDVIPFAEAELNCRFPGRGARRAEDPDGLRAAWAALEHAWSATLTRVAAMSTDAVDVAVGGECSLAQTLRHLVLATDMWLGRAILQTQAGSRWWATSSSPSRRMCWPRRGRTRTTPGALRPSAHACT
jgi:hypothetical protein